MEQLQENNKQQIQVYRMKLEEQLNRCSVLGNGLIKNFSDVFDAGYPSLNKIKNELGEDTVLGILKTSHLRPASVFKYRKNNV